MTNYTLVDAEERNREHPKTFPIPPADERNNLPVKTRVKCVFANQFTRRSERMWVLITDATDGRYEGTLCNNSTCFDGLREGARIQLEARHIIDIHRNGERRDDLAKLYVRAMDRAGKFRGLSSRKRILAMRAFESEIGDALAEPV